MSITPEPKRKRKVLKDIIPLKTPFTIFIDTCDKCVFHCEFCPCNNSIDAKDVRHKIMSFDLFKKIIDDMTYFNEKVRVVSLYKYGEPLLNPHFPDMLKYLRDKNICDEIRVTSNGYLLNKKLCEKLVNNGLDLFRLSLYGLSNKEYFLNTGVKVNYDKLKDNISYLYNYSKKNGGNLKVSVKAVPSFITSDEKLEQLNNEFSNISDYLYVDNIYDLWPKYSFANKYEELSYAQRKYVQNNQISLCSYLFTTMMIFSNGDVGICDIDWKHETKYGSILSSNLVDLWNGEIMKSLRLKFCQSKTPPIEFCTTCKKIFIDNLNNDRELIIERILKNI